ncbi:MAG: hypothetical protein IJ071_00815 [Ruminococcus sp.]|nr:hypothetical protein [Ruminococcus sp.]
MKNTKKHSPLLGAVKAAAVILAVVFPGAMAIPAGAGIMSHRDTYGDELWAQGLLLLISGAAVLLAGLLTLSRKSLPNILALLLDIPGIALCMAMVYKICDHADRAGWSDKFTMEPVSHMYKGRLIPCVIPAALILIIAVLQLSSEEASAERRRRRQLRLEKENAPAPPVIDEEDL